MKNKYKDALEEIYEEEFGEEEWPSETEDSQPHLTPRQQQEQVRQTMRELLIGIGLVAALGLLLGCLLFEDKIRFAAGVVMGTATAAVLTVMMYRSVIVAVELEKKQAEKYMKRKALLRMVIMIAVIVTAEWGMRTYGFCGAVFGILTLKLSAYLWPVIHKYIPKIRGKK